MLFEENKKSGFLISGELHDHVRVIAKLTEKAGGWRNFCTDDQSEDLQTMFIGSRLRDTTLGALDDDSVTAADRELKWGDMPRQEIDRDDLLEIYHGTMVEGLVYCYPMVRFRVTRDDRYYLLDYETDFDKNSERLVLIGNDALTETEKWIEKMVGIHGLLRNKK